MTEREKHIGVKKQHYKQRGRRKENQKKGRTNPVPLSITTAGSPDMSMDNCQKRSNTQRSSEVMNTAKRATEYACKYTRDYTQKKLKQTERNKDNTHARKNTRQSVTHSPVSLWIIKKQKEIKYKTKNNRKRENQKSP